MLTTQTLLLCNGETWPVDDLLYSAARRFIWDDLLREKLCYSDVSFPTRLRRVIIKDVSVKSKGSEVVKRSIMCHIATSIKILDTCKIIKPYSAFCRDICCGKVNDSWYKFVHFNKRMDIPHTVLFISSNGEKSSL